MDYTKIVIFHRYLAYLPIFAFSKTVMESAGKRNLERFPEYYRFQLTKKETDEVVTKCDHLSVLKYSPNGAYAFTERRVAMLSAILRSTKAIKISIRIMDAFIGMRHFLLLNAQVSCRPTLLHLLRPRQRHPAPGRHEMDRPLRLQVDETLHRHRHQDQIRRHAEDCRQLGRFRIKMLTS